MSVCRSYFDVSIQIIAFPLLSIYSSTWKSVSLETLCVVAVAVCEGYGNFYSVFTIVFSFVSCRYVCHSPDTKTYLNPYICTLCLLKTFTDILFVLSSTRFHRILRSKKTFRRIFLFLKLSRKKKTRKEGLLLLDSAVRHFPLLPSVKKHIFWGEFSLFPLSGKINETQFVKYILFSPFNIII
jgi:hypothetical protein